MSIQQPTPELRKFAVASATAVSGEPENAWLNKKR